MAFGRGWMTALCGILLSAAPTLAQSIDGVVTARSNLWREADCCGCDFIPPGPAPVHERFWVRTDYLFGWFRHNHLGTLVTTSPTGAALPQAGVLGEPTTSPLIGGNVNDDGRSGVRVVVGAWLHEFPPVALQAGFTRFGSQTATFTAQSFGDPILARPIVNAISEEPDALLIAFPGVSAGAVQVSARSGSFHEAHVNLSEAFINNGSCRVESIVGYRFYRYGETLQIGQTIFPQEPIFVPGTMITSTDEFRTRNVFHGIDLGLRGTFTFNDLSLTLLAKSAAGRLLRDVDVQGAQVTAVPGEAPLFNPGGVLALSPTIGRHTRNDWGLFHELGANLGWQVNPNLRLSAGYTFLFLHNILRAPDQLDFVVNPNLLPPNQPPQPGPERPVFERRANDLWIQSLSLGVEFTF